MFLFWRLKRQCNTLKSGNFWQEHGQKVWKSAVAAVYIQTQAMGSADPLRLQKRGLNAIHSKMFTYAVKRSTYADIHLFFFTIFKVQEYLDITYFFSKLAIWCTLIIQVILLVYLEYKPRILGLVCCIFDFNDVL